MRLLLKTRDLERAKTNDGPAVAKLLAEIAADERIILIDATWETSKTYGLMSVCDAYISLHRAEGFGITISEAMLLGKPVIVTNYSGNRDFTTESNSCLIDYRLVPVGENEYWCWQQQYWAESDIEHAAQHMRRLFVDANYAHTIGEAGRLSVVNNHSVGVVGARIANRIGEIDTLRRSAESIL